MATLHYISTQDLCTHFNLEFSFFDALEESGLIELSRMDGETRIPVSQIQALEQMIRMHEDLGINLEGIEAILHLLERVQNMQLEIHHLKNRLSLYENR
ncbi:MAG: chaperone modulator CbpM [Chitinophagaceae bacterium]